MLSELFQFLDARPTIVALCGLVIGLLAVGAAAASAWFARMQFRGGLVVFWRLREAGFTTVDVIVRNVGGGSVHGVEIISGHPDFQTIDIAELPAATEYCIDTLDGKSRPQEYYTRHGWRRRLRLWRRTWRIDPARFAGVQTRGVTALRKIADTLGSVERTVRDALCSAECGAHDRDLTSERRDLDSPVWCDGCTSSGSLRDTADTYPRRDHVGSNWRQNRPSGSSAGTHEPKDVMRVVVDPELLSEEDEKKLASYLDRGEITWHYGRHHWPKARYRILTVVGAPRSVRVMEFHAVYEQDSPGREDDDGAR